ncbi:MAG: phosphatase PAP2 family protein [Lachnospiraceae bacterium]|nr:phosphatase PAP2 family protein [Lachnospiraceae bacterium]
MEFLRVLEGIRTPLLDWVFLFFTLGGEEIMLLGLICILYWCVNKKLAYRMTFAYLPSALAINIIKLSCRIERPWVRDPSFTAVERAKKSAAGYSFPSGHTQNSTALFGTLAYTRKKLLPRILFLLIIPLVMLSRMYLGVHTPADVFASLAISSVIVFGINVLADRVEFTHKMRLILACVFVLLAIGTAIYTYVLYASGMIVYKDAADSFKGCGGGLAFAICWVLETRFVNFDVKCDKLWKQVLKVVIGMGVLLLLKEGLKFTFNSLFGQNFINEIVRYFLLLTWAMLGMPMIIKKFFAS